jgi:single-strand DNA-binding protein
MSKSVNKVILLGRVGKDPELKYTASGVAFCRLSLATSESWADKASGERQEKTEWHNLVAWNRTAEIINQYVTKGAQLYVEGSLQTREWDDREGNKRRTTEIRVSDVTLLGGKGNGGIAPRTR